MTTDAHLFETIRQSNAKTDAICYGKPVLIKIRTALLQLEQKAHATGWDGPDAFPRMFIVLREKKTDAISIKWAELWNGLLPALMKLTNSNLGKCLKVMAEEAEDIRRAASGGLSDFMVSMRDDPMIRRAIDQMIERAGSGEDLHAPALRGYEVFGYGVRFEAWSAMAPPRDEEAAAELRRVSRARQIDTLPDRIETRAVQVATRDNRLWLLARYRGFRPLVSVFEPGGNEPYAGGVPNALSRMLAATVTSPVTIIPDDIPDSGAPYFRKAK